MWYLDENASSPDNVTLGRVHFVSRDLRADTKHRGEVTLIMHPVYFTDDLPADLKEKALKTDPALPAPYVEVFLCNDPPVVYIRESQIKRRHRSIFLDYNFGTNNASMLPYNKSKFIVRQIFAFSPLHLRNLSRSHPHRAELELKTYGRQDIIERLTTL